MSPKETVVALYAAYAAGDIEQQKTPHQPPQRTPTVSALSFPATKGEV
jgi:hypothetical protein